MPSLEGYPARYLCITLTYSHTDSRRPAKFYYQSIEKRIKGTIDKINKKQSVVAAPYAPTCAYQPPKRVQKIE
jgi:hypothetical protein